MSELKAKEAAFLEDLRSAVNRHSQENASDTPDFILARLLLDALGAFEKASNRRVDWYGGRQRIGSENEAAALRAERDSWRARAEKAEQYAINLQRIIEALAREEQLPPGELAPHHSDLASKVITRLVVAEGEAKSATSGRDFWKHSCEAAEAKLAKAREMLTNATGASGEDEAKQFAEWGLLDSALSVPIPAPKEPRVEQCAAIWSEGSANEGRCTLTAGHDSLCAHRLQSGWTWYRVGPKEPPDEPPGKAPPSEGNKPPEKAPSEPHWSTKVFGAIPESAEAPGPEPMPETDGCNPWQHGGLDCRDATEVIRNQGSEISRLKEGWKTEAREGRATFEQSCRNLERTEKAEAERDQARAALKDLLWAGSRASIGDNREYRMAEEAARAHLASVEKGETPGAGE